MPESEEALLRRAAQTVRALAEEATPGPWLFSPTSKPGTSLGHGTLWFAGQRHVEAVQKHPGDAAWTAAMNPALAEPLAAWLDDTADNLRGRVRWGVTSLAPPNHVTSALIVARTLLGVSAVPAPLGDNRQEEQ